MASNSEPSERPDLDGYPEDQDDLRINDDRDNPAHDPHFDVMQSVPGGVDKTRVTPRGEVLGGETQIGPQSMEW